jgi:hypothetical protein
MRETLLKTLEEVADPAHSALVIIPARSAPAAAS